MTPAQKRQAESAARHAAAVKRGHDAYCAEKRAARLAKFKAAGERCRARQKGGAQ